jgi:hypothetical protein
MMPSITGSPTSERNSDHLIGDDDDDDDDALSDSSHFSESVDQQSTGSSTAGRGNHPSSQQPPGESTISAKETRALLRIQLIGIAILVASTVGVVSFAYKSVQREEQHAFDEHYREAADTVISGVGSALANVLGEADAFGVTFYRTLHCQQATSGLLLPYTNSLSKPRAF